MNVDDQNGENIEGVVMKVCDDRKDKHLHHAKALLSTHPSNKKVHIKILEKHSLNIEIVSVNEGVFYEPMLRGKT